MEGFGQAGHHPHRPTQPARLPEHPGGGRDALHSAENGQFGGRQGSKLGYGVETGTRPLLRLDETVLPVTLILRGRLKAVSGCETIKADNRPGLAGDFLLPHLIVGQAGIDVGQLQLDALPIPTLLIGPLAADGRTLSDDLHPLGEGFGDV